jgi:2-hydroxychromene-2-carboxylate isomerase
VLARELPSAESWEAFRCAEERDIALSQVERTAAEQGLQPLRWPDPFPVDSLFAMRVATYAKQIGRTVAFALAAYRQAFAGGRSLAEPDNVVIAAAACEMHPSAVMKAADLRGVRSALEAATARAIALGVRDVPAVWDGERVNDA